MGRRSREAVARALSALVVAACVLQGNAADAQCASCGNPAFVSGGNDLGRQLDGATASGLSLRSTLAYGYSTSNTYYRGSEDIGSLDNFSAQFHILSLAVAAELAFGTSLDVVVPVARLESDRNFAGHVVDSGLGDLELRVRHDIMKTLAISGARVPRLLVSVGVAAPTGVYVERTSTDDISQFDNTAPTWGDDAGWEDINIAVGGDSSRYLSIGRGSWWLLADVEVMGSLTDRLGWYAGVLSRMPLTFAPDGFEWGSEIRPTAGLNAVIVPARINAGVTGELLWRGHSTEVLYNKREDFANGGGLFGYLTPSIQGVINRYINVGVALRLPVYRDVVGDQIVDNMGVWMTLGGRFSAFGGATATVASAATTPDATSSGAEGAAVVAAAPSTAVGEPPLRPEIAALLVPGTVTMVDYWASWCQPCQKLDVDVQAWLQSQPDGVVVRRFDASGWGKDQWLRYLPDAPTLPVLEIYGADGRLVRRLSGDEAFRFREHLPKPAVASARR